MPIPDLTHLQLLILCVLSDGLASGRVLREKLAGEGAKKSGPAFYQLMARLEDAGLVKGWYVQKVVAGQVIKERKYEITADGAAAWSQAVAFYRARLRGGVAHA